jgi:hypothetical protein
VRIPDSPEGVALALTMMILGGINPPAGTAAPARDEGEVIVLYRRCLAAVQDTDVGRERHEMRVLTKQH